MWLVATSLDGIIPSKHKTACNFQITMCVDFPQVNVFLPTTKSPVY